MICASSGDNRLMAWFTMDTLDFCSTWLARNPESTLSAASNTFSLSRECTSSFFLRRKVRQVVVTMVYSQVLNFESPLKSAKDLYALMKQSCAISSASSRLGVYRNAIVKTKFWY